jgi:hypothetical protein
MEGTPFWYNIMNAMQYLHLSNIETFIRQPMAVVMFTLPDGIGCWECEVTKIKLNYAETLSNIIKEDFSDHENSAFYNAYYPEDPVGLFIVELNVKDEVAMLKYHGITQLPCVVRYEYGVPVEKHEKLADYKQLVNLMFRDDYGEN